MEDQRMKWTKEPPTEPGWYWFKNFVGGIGITHLGDSQLRQAKDGYLAFVAGEVDVCMSWAGPIEEPSE